MTTHTPNARHSAFIDTLVSGGKPTIRQFMRTRGIDPVTRKPMNGQLPPSPLRPTAALQTNTPGINPAGPQIPFPTAQKAANPIMSVLDNPFLLNILAQSGSSLTPGPSPLGVIGRAGIATNRQNEQRDQFDLQKRLFEAQILGLTKPTDNGIGNVNPKDFTPESLETFRQTRNFGDLVGLGPDTSKVQERLNELGDDLRAESRGFQVQKEAFKRIEAAAVDPSAAGDLALIFAFMKVQDPGSTVREGEFASAQNSAGVDQRIRALYNNVINGQRLGDTQREDFVRTSQRLFNSAAQEQSARNDRFRQRAINANIPEAFIDPILFPASQVDVLPSTGLGSDLLEETPTNQPTALQPDAKVLGRD